MRSGNIFGSPPRKRSKSSPVADQSCHCVDGPVVCPRRGHPGLPRPAGRPGSTNPNEVLVRAGLEKSEGWRQVQQYMTPENRNKILKAVYLELQRQGMLIEGAP